MNGTPPPKPHGRMRPCARDLAIGCALVGVVGLLFLLERVLLSGKPGPVRGGFAEAIKSPVLPKRVRPPVRRAERAREPNAIAAQAPPEEAPAVDPQEGEALWLRRIEEDRVRREIAREELEILERYGLLLGTEDREVFSFLTGKLAWASDLGLEKPENLEGLFFNRTFFAAGRWGGRVEFPRAWIYLFRAMGMELPAATEVAVARHTRAVFDRGLAFTQELETSVFGAALEGGSFERWRNGLPPSDDRQAVWELRNEQCLLLFQEFGDGLAQLVPPAEMEAFREYLAVFNLAP